MVVKLPTPPDNGMHFIPMTPIVRLPWTPMFTHKLDELNYYVPYHCSHTNMHVTHLSFIWRYKLASKHCK